MQTISFPLSAPDFPVRDGVRELLEDALDQALLIANTHGEVLFATRKARVILQALFAEKSDDLIPNEIRTWLTTGDTSKPLILRHPKKGEIEIHNFPVSPSGSLSFMRIGHRLVEQGPKALLALGLTAREAEVLYWITEGKTNPEIAIILDAAPDTVKKHATNLYAKLGVPTRTSAARCALSVLLANE
ncbi:MAG: helix-turn-helix transcriptional regulator [Verrucomicrobia bacterium]|nr:helix-turn-helix transcriptional regulator [Verrucomicrobiota bacterium]MBV8377624.1 helix-turn-helix transcriptional regulator [Verrucomicrobiota bacterium]